MLQHASIAPHDSVGSNLFVHTRRGEVIRVVPRENEEINEVWLSDRDRFSYEGLYSADRLATPMVKVDGTWQEADWDVALQAAVDGIRAQTEQHGSEQLGMLVSPAATLEEMYLAQAVARGLGSNNIDHRLRQADFTGQDSAPLSPSLGQSFEQLEGVGAALVIGSNTRKEQPLAGHRLRKAALAGGAVMFVNPVDYEFNFDVHARAIVPPSRMAETLAGIAACFADAGSSAGEAVRALISDATPDETQRAIAGALRDAGKATVLLPCCWAMAPWHIRNIHCCAHWPPLSPGPVAPSRASFPRLPTVSVAGWRVSCRTADRPARPVTGRE
jgi:NADH-quinone oxidoreductase subunit G